jgi:hypothetical protein
MFVLTLDFFFFALKLGFIIHHSKLPALVFAITYTLSSPYDYIVDPPLSIFNLNCFTEYTVFILNLHISLWKAFEFCFVFE